MTEPTITIIIPVKPGGRVRALDYLATVDYPGDHVEILVAEGCRPSLQRNLAAARARGEILYFLDDDSRISPENLRRLAALFADPDLTVAGGPSLTPEGDSARQQTFGLVLSSLCGGGAVRNRYRRDGMLRLTDDRELILCNLAFRSRDYHAMGGLDERLYPNEENELLARIGKSGGKMLHDPDLAVKRSQRPTFRAFNRQLFTYGRGRAEQTLIGGGAGVAPFLPLLLLLYLCTIPFVHNRVYYLPLICYALIVAVFAVKEAFRGGRPALAPLLLVVFPLLHLSYGAGMIAGFVAPRFRRPRTGCDEATIRVVKAMADTWEYDSPGPYDANKGMERGS